jgi:hypothetical protein
LRAIVAILNSRVVGINGKRPWTRRQQEDTSMWNAAVQANLRCPK